MSVREKVCVQVKLKMRDLSACPVIDVCVCVRERECVCVCTGECVCVCVRA